MRIKKRTPEHFTLMGAEIVDQFFHTLPSNIQTAWDGFMVKNIQLKGIANPSMDWCKHNVRYGAEHSVPGCVGEMITIQCLANNAPTHSYRLCESKVEQTNGMDIIDETSKLSYQVKVIRTINNHIGIDSACKDYNNPIADFLVLVDIDDHDIYIIPNSKFTDYVNSLNECSFNKSSHGYHFRGWNCSVNDLASISILPSRKITFYKKPAIDAFSDAEAASLFV